MSAFHRSAEHRFLVLRKLGQGTYGKVQLAINKETNQEVAIKTIKKARIGNEEDMLRIRREIQILTAIRHPHIIHINEVFETKQKIVLVMQYASGGELYDYLGCHQTLPEEEARRIFRQISSAIYFCHKNKICHRDLKLENILLDDEGNAQIADFGLSNMFDERRRMNTFCGSPLYASPEIVTGTPYKGPEVDCWSLGVLLYTLIYGTMPFNGKNFKELVTHISEGKYEEPAIRSSASGLIRRLLTPNISKRATIFDVCADSWMNHGYSESLVDIAEKMVSEAVLQTKKLGVCSRITNENQKKLSRTLTTSQQNIEPIIKGDHINLDASPKVSLLEQMLNYDVKFVMNKLITAVESEGPTLKTSCKNKQESTIMTFKPWPKNGDSSFAKKVESAYVIPIFDVTSVMPQVVTKNAKNKNEKLCSSQNSNTEEVDAPSKAETNQLKFNVPPNSNESLTIPNKKIHLSKQDLEKDRINNTAQRHCVQNQTFMSRTPSSKKKAHLLGPMKFNSISLARIFSLKYEKLLLDAIKVPERKQKAPGKIILPAPFDPSTSSNTTAPIPQREAIVLPTVNVSENKHKIEQKIDKIQKAALNRNLILRSNTSNRLRIQKFLKLKKGLLCDEQRSIGRSVECNDHTNESFFYTFEKENFLNRKLHSKKIIFRNSNFNNSLNPFAFNISRAEKWKFFGSENVLMEPKQNMPLFGIAKSKSDILFPDNSTCYKMFNSCDRSSYSSGYNSLSNTLSVPNSDCSLLRSASDSDGLSFCKNMPSVCITNEDFKRLEENVLDIRPKYDLEQRLEESTLDIRSKCENLDPSYTESLQKTSERDISQYCFDSFQSSTNADQDNSKSRSLSDRKRFPIQRSISASNCVNLQMISAKDLQNIKRLLLAPSFRNETDTKIENKKQNYSDATYPCSALEDMEQGFPYSKKFCSNKFNKIPYYNDGKMCAKWNDPEVEKECLNQYMWFPHEKQQLLSAYHKDNGKFLSSPDLSSLSLEKNIHFTTNHNNIVGARSFAKSERHNQNSLSPLQFSKQNLMEMCTQNKHKLLNSDTVRKDLSSRNFAKSIDDLTEDVQMEYERKLSLPIGKSPFLSKFLNDLEKRESNILGNIFNQRHYPRTTFKPAKRSKLEKRSKSFLQLLSLKRIQEAEKELEKVDRNHRIEDEDNSGSLLEALKTHGYKGVISQRFQGSESEAIDSFNLRTPFLTRHVSPDVSHFPSMTISPYLYSSYEDDDLDLEMLNTVRSVNELYLGHKQNSPKQYIHDWLTTNQNTEYSTPLGTDSLYEIEKEQEIPSHWANERSFDEISSPEEIETPKDPYTNGTISSDQALEHYYEDSANRSDRNSLRAVPEEEKEESVQDRIWRKSFYSRFNNSALSRKERTSFLDVCDSRSETPFNVTLRDNIACSNDSKRTSTRRSSSNKIIEHSTKHREKTPITVNEKEH